MKIKPWSKNLAVFFGVFLLQACVSEDSDIKRPEYHAVVLKRADLDRSITIGPVKAMVAAGKIYLKDQWMFIGDTNKGFHIYDNSNPKTPVLKSFLHIPGSTDIAIRNNVLYVNQAQDLVSMRMDPSDGSVKLLKRIPNVFPKKVSPDGYLKRVGDDEIIVDWNKR